MTDSQARRIDWNEVPVEEALPGIERQTVHGEHQTLVRYRYAPGAHFPIHHHPQEQVTIVLTGRIVFHVGERDLTLGPGEIAILPPNVPHGADVPFDEPVDTLNMLSPRREAPPAL